MVDNFLHWIPEEEQIKRRLALDAALFSCPFNLDDFEVFGYLPEPDRPVLFQWLIRQPFVRSQDGRYSYHDVVRALFSRHTYQRSPTQYSALRRAMAQYYQKQLEQIQAEADRSMYLSAHRLKLLLAWAYQLFLLPDTASHLKAIEQILYADQYTDLEQTGELMRMLYELSHEQFVPQVSPRISRILENLPHFIATTVGSTPQELTATLHASDNLLAEMTKEPSFPPELLAPIYNKRGWAYASLGDDHRSFDDLNRAIDLDPNLADAYNGRGYLYIDFGKYHLAIDDFDRVLDQNPAYYFAYAHRARAYLWLGNIDQARSDFIKAWKLGRPRYVYAGWMTEWCTMCQEKPDPHMGERLEALAVRVSGKSAFIAFTHICRGVAMWLQGHFEDAFIELEKAVTVKPKVSDALFWKGIVCISLGRDEAAVVAIESALLLEEYPLPPVLLTPLRLFEGNRPDFHEKYILPLLTRYHV